MMLIRTSPAEMAGNHDPQLCMIKQLLIENGCETDLCAAAQREMERLQACYSPPEHA